MSGLDLYGPSWSAYTRTVRIVLALKGVDYQLIEVDFSGGAMPADQVQRHPFAKVPSLDHDGFVLYETAAINRYLDAVFPHPALQPKDPRRLARMAQIVGVTDAYLSGPIRNGLVTEALVKPMLGYPTDQPRVEQAIEAVGQGLGAIEQLLDGGSNCLVSSAPGLADAHLAPLIDYLTRLEAGTELLAGHAMLAQWWAEFSGHPAVAATAFDLSVFART